MDLGRVVRGVEAERLHVEPPGGAEQGIGRDHPVPLRADEAGARRHQILLRVEHVERRALAARTSDSAAECATFAPSWAAQAAMTAVWVWLRISSSTMRACIASSLDWRI